MAADLNAVYDRDPACENYVQVLRFKGFLALQVRVLLVLSAMLRFIVLHVY